MHLWWTHWSCVTIVYYSQLLNYLLVQDGWTALHVACHKGHDEVVQTLMIAKADFSLQNNVSTSTVQLIIVSADDHRHKLGKHCDPLCAYIVCCVETCDYTSTGWVHCSVYCLYKWSCDNCKATGWSWSVPGCANECELISIHIRHSTVSSWGWAMMVVANGPEEVGHVRPFLVKFDLLMKSFESLLFIHPSTGNELQASYSRKLGNLLPWLFDACS